MRLHFYGAAKMVTGANYLLEINGKKILIDCGLFQGEKFADKLNYEDWKFKPEEIDCVLITHSHIDHIGRLPKLYKDGFLGNIYSTPPTRDFAELALIDSANLLRKEAEEIGKMPLYAVDDIPALMEKWIGVGYYKKIEIAPGVNFTFYNAGHILGSAFILIEANGKKIIFSGDMGNPPVLFLNPPDKIDDVDYVILESAYGDRGHNHIEKRRALLEDLIEEAVLNKGVLLIPAFAMERTQQMLFEINELVEKKKIPYLPIFIDSPLAMKFIGVYTKYQNYFNKETLEIIKSGDEIFNFPGLEFTYTRAQSEKIEKTPPPKIIIAGSGMMQGGRIINHLINYLSDSKNILLIVSYQAKDSLGRKILDGAKEVEILGQKIKVGAKVVHIDSYSAHADQTQLLYWLASARKKIKKVFVVQGEEESAGHLAVKIKDTLAVNAVVPNLGEVVDL